MTDMNWDTGSFWDHYEQGCNELRGVQTVDEVMRICKSHYGSSSGEAFFPGGSGDEDLFSILLDASMTPAHRFNEAAVRWPMCFDPKHTHGEHLDWRIRP